MSCDQCGSCCIQLKNIINIERKDIGRWVKDCRTDILQYCNGWYDELSDYLIFGGNKKTLVDYFMESTNMEMWFDPKTKGEIYLCPFLRKKRNEDKFECIIQDIKPEICRKYRCNPTRMLGIIKKPVEENLKEHKKERKRYLSVWKSEHKPPRKDEPDY